MVLNAHCNSICVYQAWENMFVLLLQISVFLNLTVGLIQFWESSQMFDLHHPNKAQLNFTQQNWHTVGQQILENLAFE